MADPKLRILVVDDFSTMRRIVRNLLKELGFTSEALPRHREEIAFGGDAKDQPKAARNGARKARTL